MTARIRVIYVGLLELLLTEFGFLVSAYELEIDLDPIETVEGDSFNISCTLSQPLLDAGCTSSNITFSRADDLLPAEMVTVTGPRTAVLTIHKASPQYKIYFCDTDSVLCGYHTNSVLVAVTTRLETPRNVSCVVDSWKEMTCTWLPVQPEVNAENARPIRTYIIEKGYSPVYIEKNKHVWNFGGKNGERSFQEEIQFKIQVTNSLETVSTTLHTVKPNSIVKLRPIQGISVSPAGQYAMEMTWFPPKSYNTDINARSLIFEYRLDLNNTKEIKTYTKTTWGGDNRWMILNMAPFTPWTYSFSVRSENSAYLSEPTKGNFVTPADVPSANPTLYEGGYQTGHNRADLDTRRVTIFWKKIAKEEENGIIIHHKVLLEPFLLGPAPHETKTVLSKGNQQSVEVTLLKDRSFMVQVLACTSVGCHGEHPGSKSTRSHSNKMFIPKESLTGLTDLERFYVDGATGILRVNWVTLNGNGAAIFWCNDSCQRGPESSGFIGFLPGQSRSFTIGLPPGRKYTNYKVGMSIARDHAHRGITWAQCIYHVRGHLTPPTILNVYREADHNSLLLRWTSTKCSPGAGYAERFIIYYCPVAQGSEECDEPEHHVTVASESLSHTLTGLREGEMYKIWMKAVSNHTASIQTTYVYKETSQSWLTTTKLAILIGTLMPLGLIGLVGLTFVFRKCRQCQKHYTSVEVILPPGDNQDTQQGREDSGYSAESLLRRTDSPPMEGVLCREVSSNSDEVHYTENRSEASAETESSSIDMLHKAPLIRGGNCTSPVHAPEPEHVNRIVVNENNINKELEHKSDSQTFTHLTKSSETAATILPYVKIKECLRNPKNQMDDLHHGSRVTEQLKPHSEIINTADAGSRNAWTPDLGGYIAPANRQGDVSRTNSFTTLVKHTRDYSQNCLVTPGKDVIQTQTQCSHGTRAYGDEHDGHALTGKKWESVASCVGEKGRSTSHNQIVAPRTQGIGDNVDEQGHPIKGETKWKRSRHCDDEKRSTASREQTAVPRPQETGDYVDAKGHPIKCKTKKRSRGCVDEKRSTALREQTAAPQPQETGDYVDAQGHPVRGGTKWKHSRDCEDEKRSTALREQIVAPQPQETGVYVDALGHPVRVGTKWKHSRDREDEKRSTALREQIVAPQPQETGVYVDALGHPVKG